MSEPEFRGDRPDREHRRVMLPGGISVPRAVFVGLVAAWVIGSAVLWLVVILGGADLVVIAYWVVPTVLGGIVGFAAAYWGDDDGDPPPPWYGGDAGY